MPLSKEDWHHRFRIQAQWTEALRLYFYDLIRKESLQTVLDVGCGTGALLPEMDALSPAVIFGLDIELDHLIMARQISPEIHLIGSDVHHLPFESDSFDLVTCHYFLMWVGNPEHALSELYRITKPGGCVVAFAEPDYGGRIDYPPEFIQIKDLQISSLLDAGADPRMGRKLKSLFAAGGFENLEYGVYQGAWQGDISNEEFESEWKVLKDDLAGMLNKAELQALQNHDLKARQQGSRIVYVPTFYAWGTVIK
jgi:ubiquinone/menaquinone biosynthesis C-methylase UbiE